MKRYFASLDVCIIYSYRSGFEPLRSKELWISLLYVKILGLLASTGVSLDDRNRKPIEEYYPIFTDDRNPANK